MSGKVLPFVPPNVTSVELKMNAQRKHDGRSFLHAVAYAASDIPSENYTDTVRVYLKCPTWNEEGVITLLAC